MGEPCWNQAIRKSGEKIPLRCANFRFRASQQARRMNRGSERMQRIAADKRSRSRLVKTREILMLNDQTKFRSYAFLAGLCFSILAGVCSAADALPAFPGAEGFGANTPGGRGGKVLVVTNLEDFLPREKPIEGSLRAACMTKGPRIVVFRVSGTIPLKAPLDIREPFLTLAGQSAPGDGICLKNFGLSILTNDVVVRHLRVRPGDELGPEYKKAGKSFTPDGISIAGAARNVVVDHCSVSWAIDECLSVSGAGITDVTVQWCIVSESLNDSFHNKGKHGYASLLRCNGNLSFHHNLYAHHSSRSPRPGTYGEGSVLLDFRNNVIHDSVGYSAADPVRMNYVGNFIKRPRKESAFNVGGEKTSLFAAGNEMERDGQVITDQWTIVSRATEQNRVEKEFPVPPVNVTNPRILCAVFQRECGATLPRRDKVDERIIDQLIKGAGNLINSQAEVGGYPELRTKNVPADADNDGMPDAWEKEHGLDAANAADAAKDADGDGYTNIEEFLNRKDPTKKGRRAAGR